ncbi:MAG: transposase zinc-binding domain-containing protein, partial [Deltaproteobacteria bacterium]|nr:transposase zinc-binding domain-containing protein [Deltaproteobacteria bacterium]
MAEELDGLESDLTAASPHGSGLPRHVRKELDAFLLCGRLERGFARVVCRSCRAEHLVAFSCHGRAVCPSCTGRRMSDGAAHLVDRVIPRVPVRQFVVTFAPR